MFDTVFIRNIPLLTLNKKTQARRFITLIDAFYDHKVNSQIICPDPISLNETVKQTLNRFNSLSVFTGTSGVTS